MDEEKELETIMGEIRSEAELDRKKDNRLCTHLRIECSCLLINAVLLLVEVLASEVYKPYLLVGIFTVDLVFIVNIILTIVILVKMAIDIKR